LIHVSNNFLSLFPVRLVLLDVIVKNPI